MSRLVWPCVAPADPLFIGIDLGTARLKIGLYDRWGTERALHVASHSVPLGPGGRAVVQDAGYWWRAVCRGLRALATGLDASCVVAIAVCGQGPTLVSVDARLHPRGPALTWMDTRATSEAEELARRIGRPVQPGHYVAKALRLSRTDPDPRRRWYLQAWDYIAARLCGVPHASATWFEQEIAASGLPRDHFPPYIAPGRQVGALTPQAARACGLPPGIPVVAGTNDSIAACIGGGLTRKGQAVILGGTSGGFVLCWDPVPGAWAPPPGTYPEPPGLRYLGATISSSGLALDWLAALAGVRDYGAWLARAATVEPGAEGLLFLPYLAGVFLPYTVDEHGPLNDPAARGIFFGLSTGHTGVHLLRAVLEGVAYGVRQVYESTAAQAGGPTTTLTVGGQAQSALWNRIKADVLGLPVLIPASPEAGALGAACIAAAGSGTYTSLWEAAETMVHIKSRIEPDPAAHRRYSRLYAEVYQALYPSVRGLFPRLAGLAGD